MSKNKFEKGQIWRTYTADFMTYYTVTVIDRVWYWCRKKHVDQQNRIKSQNSLTYLWPTDFFFFFNKSDKVTQWTKDYLQENVLRQIDIRVPVSSLACNELGSPDSHLQNKKKAKQTGSQQSFLHQSENWGHRANHCLKNLERQTGR